MIKKVLSSLATLWVFVPTLLAQQEEIEMADKFIGEGKIYVVIAVVLIIFFIILFYTIRMDKKVSRMEDEVYNR